MNKLENLVLQKSDNLKTNSAIFIKNDQIPRKINTFL